MERERERETTCCLRRGGRDGERERERDSVVRARGGERGRERERERNDSFSCFTGVT